MTDFERELRSLNVAWPPAPELRIALARRRRRRMVVAVALVTALVAAFAVPQSRSAILHFFHLGGVTVVQVDTLPPAQERPLSAGLGQPVGDRAAARTLGAPFLPARHGTLYGRDGFVSTLLHGPVLLSEFGSPYLIKKVALGKGRVRRGGPWGDGPLDCGRTSCRVLPRRLAAAGRECARLGERECHLPARGRLASTRPRPAARARNPRNRRQLSGVRASCAHHFSSCSHWLSFPAASAAGPWLGTASNGVGYTAAVHGTTTVVADGSHSVTLTGKWGLPRVTLNNDVGGLSTDGRLLVLAQEATPLIRTALLRRTALSPFFRRSRCSVRETVTIKGDFGFDALSPHGRTMYLIEHVSEENLFRYRVRAYDLVKAPVDLACGRRQAPARLADGTAIRLRARRPRTAIGSTRSTRTGTTTRSFTRSTPCTGRPSASASRGTGRATRPRSTPQRSRSRAESSRSPAASSSTVRPSRSRRARGLMGKSAAAGGVPDQAGLRGRTGCVTELRAAGVRTDPAPCLGRHPARPSFTSGL